MMEKIGSESGVMNRDEFFKPILPMIESIYIEEDHRNNGYNVIHYLSKIRMVFNLPSNLIIDHDLLDQYFEYVDKQIYSDGRRKLDARFIDYDLGCYVYSLWHVWIGENPDKVNAYGRPGNCSHGYGKITGIMFISDGQKRLE